MEEHNIIGGFGESCKSALFGKVGAIDYDYVAVDDKFGETGVRASLFPIYGLDNETIYRKAKGLVK